MSTYAERYRLLAHQAAYRRHVIQRGLPALLAPYTIRTAALPTQRTKSPQPLPDAPVSG